ncbi:MAG: hypothetical protein C7B46_09135 [Sulfobacillus benefaciens]|uniref:Uncharacterized protein n=1 Tax=Sulfobacillus benefaciens TaxID=453960 RepID=A0A2T2XGC6_9FIRM|nr:MAG: hypothetical protein C7B46_09135 [Sulfobacillus benefaciens]
MAGERRGASIEGLEMSSTDWEERMDKPHPYAIPRGWCIKPTKRVKANRGVDGESPEWHLKDNLFEPPRPKGRRF